MDELRMSVAIPIIRTDLPVLIFGGCYSNLQATSALLEHSVRLNIPANRRICTGDIVAYGADAEACAALVRRAVDNVVLGNCEQSLANEANDCGCGFQQDSDCDRLSKAWFSHANRQVTLETRNWMASLPRRIDLEIGGFRFAVVHGGVEQINRFIFASTNVEIKRRELDRAGVDGVIGGHSGLPFSQSIAGRLWHNSGSVGMPANDGTNRVWFSVIFPTEGGLEIEHRTISYDCAAAAASMRKAALPAEYSDALETGLWASCDILPTMEIKERGIPLVENCVLWLREKSSKRRGKITSLTLWPQANVNQTRQLSKSKFSDPLVTADGQSRASVELQELETLWFNTGTLCNIECRNCYIESSPKNDRLAYLKHSEVVPFLDEIKNDGLATREIGFTGGEPFMNPDILFMMEDCLRRGFEVLVLTNAMRPMQRSRRQLLDLQLQGGEKLNLRVSLDHYRSDRHEDERGPRTYRPTLDGLIWLSRNGFNVSVAGRTMWNEDIAVERAGYAALFAEHAIGIDAYDPSQLILFPEMDSRADVPEITTKCWGILGKSPSDVMCSRSRMIVRRKGDDRPTVVACTLLPYEKGFELGSTLRGAVGPVALNHPHCARFCVLGGASCSVATGANTTSHRLVAAE